MADNPPATVRQALLQGTTREVLAHRVLLLDGGQATELEKDARVDLSETCLWSAALLLEKNAQLQDVVTSVHKAYYLAGADVATTVSYQASLEGFQREGVAATSSDMEKYYNKSIELASQARDDAWTQLRSHQETATRIKPLVAGSIGCYGAALADGSEYRGEYGKSVAELVAWHYDRFAFFARHEKVDFVLCETIPCLDEVSAIVELVNAFPTVRAMISVACRDGKSLNNGDAISRLTAHLQKLNNPAQVLAVGVNCTAPQHVESLLRSFECACVKLAYPNSGEGYDATTKQWVPCELTHDGSTTPWRLLLPKWHDAGARVFGGCCRTTPSDIQTMRAFVRETYGVLEEFATHDTQMK